MRKKLQLNKGWSFQKGIPEGTQIIVEDALLVDLPHIWNGIDGQDGGNDYYRGSCCYSKQILLPMCI